MAVSQGLFAGHAAVSGGVEEVARVAGVAAGWSRALVAWSGAGLAVVGGFIEEEALVAGGSAATEDIEPCWADDGVACHGPDVGDLFELLSAVHLLVADGHLNG